MKTLLQFFFASIILLVSYADVRAVNEHPESEALLQVIRDISERYHVHFTYDREIVEDVKVKDYDPDNYVDVEDALQSVLKSTTLKYVMLEMKYVIIYQDDAAGMKSLEQMIDVLQKIIAQKKEKRQVSTLNGLESLTELTSIHLQKHRMVLNVTGTVTDQSGEPLIGVNIQVKESNIGTATDFEGQFTLEDVNENATLVFSYIGYQTQEFALNGRSNINISLVENSQMLDEVVVVGYGTQKKENVIGSVSQISDSDITQSPVSAVSNSLAGRMPGVVVQQRSGEPGNNGASILIRGKSTLGNNGPLVIVDGIQGRDINSLNPDDISKISVLKDASAAIYGARAANGVILVTTKKGGGKQSMSVNYNFYTGFNSPTKLPEMADASTYATMVREAQSYNGVSEENMLFSLDDIMKYESGDYPWTHPNTDPLKETLAKSSGIDHHNLSISGGTDKLNYYSSFGYQEEDGIYKNNATNYKRFNLNINLGYTPNDYVEFNISSKLIKENKLYPTKSSGEIFQNIQVFRPTEIMEWPNGFPGPDVGHGYQPKIMTGFEYGTTDENINNSYNTLSAKMILPWIKQISVFGSYSFDFEMNNNKIFETPYSLYSLDKVAYLGAGNTGKEDGSNFLVATNANIPEPRLTDFFSNSNRQTKHLRINYENVFNDKHAIDAFVAYESYDYYQDGFGAFRRYFISEEIPYQFAGSPDNQQISSTVGNDASQNFIGRLSYVFDNTYHMQFSLRRDGSIRFSKESGRWGNFPSLLLGYVPSNKDWWSKNINYIDYFKLKATYGQLGNDLVNPYQYLASYGFSGGMVSGSSRAFNQGLRQTGIPNPNITWEVANVFNIGFESLSFKDKLIFDAEIFYERRNNILVKRQGSVPNYAGIDLSDENFGIVENKGFETVLGYRDVVGEFSYNISGNLSFFRNKIIEYDEPERNVPWQIRTGFAQGAELVYNSIGIFKDEAHINSYPHVLGAKPGDIILEDFDGNGEINSDDQVLMPLNRDPEIMYGANVSVDYKDFQLSLLFQGIGRAQSKIYNELTGLLDNYFNYTSIDRWTPNNIEASNPRSVERTSAYWRTDEYNSTYYYHSTDYLRLKNISLAYNIPMNLNNRIGLKKSSVFINGQNLLLLYRGNDILDPETGFGRAPNYPVMKTISIGINVTF